MPCPTAARIGARRTFRQISACVAGQIISDDRDAVRTPPLRIPAIVSAGIGAS